MYMEQLDWNLLKSFTYVVREGSLSGAARALNSTQPTIGRHIEALESQLGLSLFTRSREGLAPTEEALNILPEAEAMTGSYGALLRKISGENQDDIGTVRLAVSEIMGTEVMPALLVKFHNKHPNIKIELSISNKTDNLLKRDADLAIRMSSPKQDALVAKNIGISPIGLFCHKDYIKRCGSPQNLGELKNHKVIGPDEDNGFLKVLKMYGLDLTREDIYFRADNQLAQMNLLRKGLGIGAMQIQLAKKERNLIHLFENEVHVPMPIWVVMHEDLRASKRVRALYNFLADELATFLK